MSKHKYPFSHEFLLHLGDAIRSRRINLFLSQEELGFRAHLHRTYVTDVENGLRNISMITLLRISQALKSRPSTQIVSAENAVNNEHGKNTFD